MTVTRTTLFAMSLSAMLALPCAADEQEVWVRTASHLPQATDKSESYRAKCGEFPYEVLVSKAARSVVFASEGRATVDLSQTRLGVALLDPAFYGRVGFNCPMGAINVFLGGVWLDDTRPATGARYRLSIRDGAVREDSALESDEEPVDKFARRLGIKR
jgi:hypothetical protein